MGTLIRFGGQQLILTDQAFEAFFGLCSDAVTLLSGCFPSSAA